MRAINCRTLLALIFAVVVSVGCSARPDFRAPGPIGLQRERAVVHDPFPDNTMGPPIDGARPREYSRPLPAAKNLQINPWAGRDNRGAYGY